MKTNSHPTEQTTDSIAVMRRRERTRNATILVLAGLFVASYVGGGPRSIVTFITESPHVIQAWLHPRSLKMPAGLALDTQGDLYEVDSENNRVVEFKPDGQLIRTWGTHGTGPGQFDPAHAITVDSQGNVYVTEEAADVSVTGQSGRVEKFHAQGRFLLQWDVYRPTGIVVDQYDRVYVATQEGVQKYSSKGILFQELGTPRSDKDLAEEAIAIDRGDHIYVIDNLVDGPAVTQFGIDGQIVRSWRPKFSDATNLHHVVGIGVDGRGSIYVADQTQSTILKFSDTGTFMGTVGGHDSNGLVPGGIAVDGTGLVYISDLKTNRVQQFSAHGDLLREFGQ